MTTSTLTKQRVQQLLGFGALIGVVACAAYAEPAWADDLQTDPSTIDATATGSIHITRYDQSDGTTPAEANGLKNDSVPNAGVLSGVEYEICRVDGIDLTTEKGWTDLQALTEPASSALKDCATVETEADGTASKSGLAVGAYWITETLTDEQIAAGHVPAAPFMVTVPFTHPTDLDHWVYDTYVYPKSRALTITKSVADSTAVARGYDVTWTVKATIPKDANGQTVSTFRIDDIFNGQIAPEAGDFTVAADAVPLTEDDDFTLTPTPSPIADTAWGRVSFDFADCVATGGKCVDAKEVTITYTTAVLNHWSTLTDADGQGLQGSPTIGSGDVLNQAQLHAAWSNGTTQTQTSLVHATAVTKWAPVTITKTEADGTTPLPGAQFMVFTDEGQAKKATSADAAIRDAARKQAVDVLQKDGTSTDVFTTADQTGTVTVDGLRYSAHQDGTAITTGTRTYYAVEVGSPSGYELNPEVREFTVGDAAPTNLVFKDVETRGGFKLPLAGGTGIAVIVGLSLLVIAGAAFGYRRMTAADRAVWQDGA